MTALRIAKPVHAVNPSFSLLVTSQDTRPRYIRSCCYIDTLADIHRDLYLENSHL